MKLEITHLAPYLPYGLILHEKWSDRQCQMVSLSADEQMIGCTGIGGMDVEWGNLDAFKPILRPLSDLALSTSPLTITGLNRMRGVTIKDSEYEVVVDDGECIICKWGGVYSFYIERQTMSFYSNSISGISPQLDMFIELFANHFDVFNLIPAGLAVDVNTIP